MKDYKTHTILNAVAATGVGNSILIADYMHIILEAAFTSATIVIKFQGSISETCPDFSGTQASSNTWDYVEVIDLQDGSSISGDTGITNSGASSDVRLFELNINGLRWFNVSVTTFTAGTVTVKATTFNNQ